MNRFDRVTSLFLLLQTRSIITAEFLSDHFNVSKRTIYRDIRTLENAGLPIGSEPGIGYFLEKGYQLPPVSFTFDEAASLLLGEKLLAASLDTNSLQDYKLALNKVRAVMGGLDKDHLNSLDSNIKVLPTGNPFPVDVLSRHYQNQGTSAVTSPVNIEKPKIQQVPHSGDSWLSECRSALVRSQVIAIDYAAVNSEHHTTRQIEPIGLFYYSWHWHLIAWCRLRRAYRDFRLDRILSFSPQSEQFARHSRLTLQQYLNEQPGRTELHEVVLFFSLEAAKFVGEQRYMFGFIDEERQKNGVKMRFLTHVPDYMSRWLLQYVDDVEVITGDSIKMALGQFAKQLATHWASD